MKLEAVEIENYRAIEHLRLPLDPSLTVLHGGNTCGKTSVLSAIAVGLGVIPDGCGSSSSAAQGALRAARQELLDPSKAWWRGRRGRLADRRCYRISVSPGVVPLGLALRGSPGTREVAAGS